MKKKALSVVLDSPEVREIVSSLPDLTDGSSPARGCVWFGEDSDRRFWCRTLGAEAGDEMTLGVGPYTLQLRLVTGHAALKELETAPTRIIYLPSEGVGDRQFYRWLSAHQSEAPYNFVRLFGRADLAIYSGDASPLDQRWREVRAEFDSSPFLGLDDKESLRGLWHWLARLVLFSNLSEARPHLEERLRRAVVRADAVCRAWTYVPPDVGSRAELLNLLLLRDHGRSVRDRMEQLRADLAYAAECVKTFPDEMARVAQDSCNDSGKKVFGVDFVITLGGELLPELQKLIAALKPFAEQLIRCSLPLLKPLGEELRDRLEVRNPMLALVGPFCSGKTTLLNILLMEKGSKRAFRSAPTANTAIISEISACEDGWPEQLTFIFRDRVEYRLLELEGDLQVFSHHKNLTGLHELVHNDVLVNPCVKYTVRVSANGGSAAHRLSREVRGRDAVLRELETFETECDEGAEEVIFHADVDGATRARALGASLPEVLDLSDEEGWEKFQGDGKQTAPFVEGVAASLLIQAADIRLRNNLLKLTAVADTPGTGSYNDLHDAITQQYLDRAEGIILLLPTRNVAAERVWAIIRRVRERYRGALDSIAFVVNCHMSQSEQDWERIVRQYEKSICKEFNLSESEWARRQSNPRRGNFFVVKLKTVEEGANPREVLGRSSLIALRAWIRRLFLSGRYRSRLEEIRRILAEEWDERRAVINDQIAEFDMDAKKTEHRLAMVRRFREATLENTKRRYLEEIEAFRSELGPGAASLAKKAERALDAFVAAPLEREHLAPLKEEMKVVYGDFNKRLGELERHDPVVRWADEMKSLLAGVRVDAPSLVPPDPHPWAPASRLALEPLNTKFTEVEAKWPTLFGRIKNYITEKTGGEDIRRTMAKELRNDFWPSHYKAIWNDRLASYLQRCSEFIETKTGEIRHNCLDREKSLSERNEATKRQLQEVLLVLQTFEGQRNEFIAEMDKAVAKGGEDEY